MSIFTAKKGWVIDQIKAGRKVKSIAVDLGMTCSGLKKALHDHGLKVSELNPDFVKRQSQVLLKAQRVVDVASRIRQLLGIEKKLEVPHTGFSDEQLKTWLNTVEGCEIFAKELWSIELQEHQLIMVNDLLKHKRNVFILGRQSGKDFVLSIFSVWQAITSPNSKILLISPSQRQSDLLYNRILELVGRRDELFSSVEKSNSESCKFRNGSSIHSLPSTGYIRGYTEVTHIFLNESCWGIPDDVFEAIMPMLALKNGVLALVSSPAGCQGRTFEYFNNPLFNTRQYPSSINKYITPEFLAEQKKLMPAEQYSTEYEAQFCQSLDCFFHARLIDAVSSEYDMHDIPDSNKTYYAGLDIGRLHDSSVFIIISQDKDTLRVENIVEMQNKPFTEQEAHIIKLNHDYRFKKIVAEYAGLGMPTCERLQEKGLPVEFFKPTCESKETAYNYLKKTMEDARLAIPKHAKLQHELRLLQFSMTGGRTRIFHLSQNSDDFADALNYAVWASKTAQHKSWSDICNNGQNTKRSFFQVA